ncbi:MAG: hypothetical protein V8S92_06605 [Oscillospiraceae bacterium]
MRRASIVFGYFLVLHTMHGHCNHTGKIRSAADRQNTQHNSFLRFESYAAFSQRLISLYSLYYTHPRGKFNRFVQFTFPVFVYSAQSLPSVHELQEVFPAIHPAFPSLHPAAGPPAKTQVFHQISALFCKSSAAALQMLFPACIPSCTFLKISVIF